MKYLKPRLKDIWHRNSFYLKIISFSMLFILIPCSVFGQIQLEGTVKDMDNFPLIGATVLVKGTNIGTVSDVDGNFSISVPNEDDILVVSYVGYLTEEVTLSGQTSLDITLVADISELEKVVVIGYGTQRKRDLTGSVATVDNERLKDIPATNLTSTLQGSIPGVSINTYSGAPGTQSDILIRGVKSLKASNDPLVVVDGILGASIDDINPNDIENIQVLKDAAAASIYGSRGSGGVIIVTTKRGKAGKVSVSYNGYYGFSSVANKVDVFSADEYVAKLREIYRQQNSTLATPISYDSSLTIPIDLLLKGNELEMYNMGKSYNWLEEVTRKAPIQGHSLALSGGNEKTQYYLSVNMLDQTGIVYSTDLQRQSVRANVSSKFTDWLKVGTSVLLTRSVQNKLPSDIFAFTYQLSPLGKKYENENNPDSGDYVLYPMYPDEYIANPFTEFQRVDKDTRTKVLNSTFLEFTPLTGFTYRVSVNSVIDINRNNIFVPLRTRQTQLFDQYENAEIRYDDRLTLNIENLVSYHKSIGEHRFTGTFVFATEEYKRDYLKIYAKNFGSDYYRWTALDLGEITPNEDVDTDEESWFLESYIGRFNYSYKDKYLLQLSARNDRSSKFSKENRNAFFPGISAGWVISDEPFLQSVSVINNLKLRVSWAQTGNQAIGYHDRFNVGSDFYYITGQDDFGTTLEGLSQTELANKDLRWEVSTEINSGLDFSLLNNRLSGTFEVYKTITTDLLWDQAIPTTTGFEEIRNNIGSLENKGIEIALHGIALKTSDFTLSASASFTANRNKIIDLDGTKTDNIEERLFIGEPVGVVYDYEFDGILQEGETPPSYMPDLEPGEAKVKNLGRMIDLDDETQLRVYEPDSVITEADQTIIGQMHPKWYGSIGIYASYKKFDLSVFINHVHGTTRLIPGSVQARSQKLDIPYYTDEHPSTQYGRPAFPLYNRDGNYYGWTSYYVDGSYTRLQDVTLAYNLSTSMLDKIGIGNIRIYVTGQNLLTITDYIGYDPAFEFAESDGRTTNQTDADISKLHGYPTIRNIIFGVNVTF